MAQTDATAAARRLAFFLVAGLGLSVAASSLSAANGRPPQAFLTAGINGAVYVVSGFFVARRRPENRIGYILLLMGAVSSALLVFRYLAPAAQVAIIAFGEIPTVLLAYVLLAYPSGRLAGRGERLIVTVVALILATYAGAVLISYEPLVHGPPGICPPCAPNPLRVTDLGVFPQIDSIGTALAVPASLVVAGLAIRRWMRASGASRQVLAPVLFGGLVIGLSFLLTSMAFLTQTDPLIPGPFFFRLLVPAGLAITFVRVYAARGALTGAVVQLGASPTSRALETAMRRTLGDPDLVVTRWSDAAAAYLDEEGRRVEVDQLPAERAVLRLEREGQPLAAVIYDAALAIDPALLASLGDAVRFTTDAAELRDRLRASGGDLSGLPRGNVAFLFGDVEGSTEMLASLGDAYIDVLAELRRVIRHEAERHHGRVVDIRADECFLAFADPRPAVSAAVAIQRAVGEGAWPAGSAPKLRVGLHLGSPELTTDGYVGLDVHVAARVMAAANGGQVLASGAFAAGSGEALPEGGMQVPLGWFRLRGIPEPQQLYRVNAPGLDSGGPPPRAEAVEAA